MTGIAVVGAGYWGPNLIRNFANNPKCDALWVCDRDPARLENIGRRFPAATLSENFGSIIESDADAVVIATPVGTHYALAKSTLEAGKHVFVEKPLAASTKEAEELVELADKKDLRLMVGHTFEYSPPVRKVSSLIDSGEMGDIFFVSSMRVNLGLFQNDISVIWDLAPHDFSILFSWIKDKPVSVSATGKGFVQAGIPDVAFISTTFESGAVAHIEVSWLAPSKLRRTTVVGSKKMLVYDDTEVVEKVKIYDRGVDFPDPKTFGEWQLSYRTGDILVPRLDQFEPLALETSEFLDSIEEGRAPLTDGRSGLQVVRALEAAQKSVEAGGAPVAL